MLSGDPSTWPVADTAGFTSADDPGWVFFRAYDGTGQGCGIGPDGTVGCDIVVPRNEDGTAYTSIPGPPGSYACSPPGQPKRCPLPPPGANQVVAGPDSPARYVDSDTLTFTRKVDVLEPGYRLVDDAMAGHQRDLAGFCFEFEDRPGQFGGDLGAPLLDAAGGLDPHIVGASAC